jgi:hypothetical protein
VFINCPFDEAYAPTFRAMIFTIFACEFQPRSALELDDGGQTRMDKLFSIIEQCRYGVHDISRTDLDTVNHLPRFNMPFELGIFFGARTYGGKDQRLKRALVLDIEKYRYQRFISDLAGYDIRAHGGDPVAAVRILRDWLANVSRRQLPSANRIEALYHAFMGELPALAAGQDFDPDDIPYVDYEHMVVDWLLAAPAV